MTGASELDSPRWRSGPYVYGAALISLPLMLLVLWALPTVLPAVLHGNFSGLKVACGAIWGIAIFAFPAAAVVFRRQYYVRDDWQRPRRLSITFSSLTYALALVSYAALALLFVRLPM